MNGTPPSQSQHEQGYIHESICLIHAGFLLPQSYSPCKYERPSHGQGKGEGVMALSGKKQKKEEKKEATENRRKGACTAHKAEIAIEKPFPQSTWREEKRRRRKKQPGKRETTQLEDRQQAEAPKLMQRPSDGIKPSESKHSAPPASLHPACLPLCLCRCLSGGGGQT